MIKVLVRFCDFVEVVTKSVSVLAFLIGASYCWYRFGVVNVGNLAAFFVAMLLFDMATTAVNNFIDCRQSAIPPHFSAPVSILLIIAMISASACIGLYLTYVRGLFVLVLGIFCFAVGIFYTFGPAPISRTPYGELASGVVMGYCIPALAIYVGAPENALLTLTFSFPEAYVYMDIGELLRIFLTATPLALTIANIMLANNICDIEADIKQNRFTLPYYIGLENAVKLFGTLYWLCYLLIGLLSITGVVPIWCALCLLTFVPVSRNIALFRLRQSKSETFVLSVVNALLINFSFFALIASGGLYNAII